MVQFNILRDNREQKPWDFDNYPVTTEDVTLSTGDYTLPELCDYDEENDTYIPHFAIERKAGNDFVSSITHHRERFLREIKRTSEWESPLPVLIEEPKTLFRRQEGFMQYRDIAPSQIFGTVDDWESYYNVKFHFVGTRDRGQQFSYDSLASRLRSELISD
jgi:ERCC4-type nuclease